jgi:hypothetical protein
MSYFLEFPHIVKSNVPFPGRKAAKYRQQKSAHCGYRRCQRCY